MQKHRIRYDTETAGTAIVATIPPVQGKRIRVTNIDYLADATEHTLTFLKPTASTTIAVQASSGQTVVQLSEDPGSKTPASGDYIVFEKPDGSFFTSTVSSWSAATQKVTLNDNVPTGGLDALDKCWLLETASEHTENLIPMLANGISSYSRHPDVGLEESTNVYEPMIVHSNNITDAGRLLTGAAIYVD